MSLRRVLLRTVTVLVVIGLLAWLGYALLTRSAETPFGPLAGLALVALIGLVVRLRRSAPASPLQPRTAPARRPPHAAASGGQAGTGALDEATPDWLADVLRQPVPGPTAPPPSKAVEAEPAIPPAAPAVEPAAEPEPINWHEVVSRAETGADSPPAEAYPEAGGAGEWLSEDVALDDDDWANLEETAGPEPSFAGSVPDVTDTVELTPEEIARLDKASGMGPGPEPAGEEAPSIAGGEIPRLAEAEDRTGWTSAEPPEEAAVGAEPEEAPAAGDEPLPAAPPFEATVGAQSDEAADIMEEHVRPSPAESEEGEEQAAAGPDEAAADITEEHVRPSPAESEDRAEEAAAGSEALPAEETAEGVQFAAYYPREVRPQDWQPLKAYIYKEFALAAVRADVADQLKARTDIRETIAAALQPIAEDALVTAIPHLPGFEFDPPQASTRFRKDWKRFDFEFRAVEAPLDEGADGRITFLVEGVIVADVKLSVYVSRWAGRQTVGPQESTARPYQAIFCSYSHKDSAIVEKVERFSRFLFTRYLRDVTSLRSGERWNDRLLEMIDEADIFQLFWSAPAAQSPYVRQEWQYALALRNSGKKGQYFIRPVRWEEPMPAPPPPELADLQFEHIKELAEG